MRKTLFLLSFIFQFALAQQAEVTNVTVAQRTDGSKIVDITYDLSEDAVFADFEITVEVSFDDGATYTQVSNVSGDVGEHVATGSGRHIIWNAGSEFGGTFDEDAAVVIKATGYTILSEFPFEVVTVPAGEYTYGPGDTVLTIDYDFEIMKYPVTNADFVLYLLDAFPEGDGPTPTHVSWNGTTYVVEEGYGNHPVVYVSWYQANDFADHYGMRLPTEHEWEKAARGNTGYNYPWGDGITGSYANYLDSGDPWDNGTTPVGFYNGQNYEGFQTSDAPSPYGAYDMAGNVWEWTDSWWGEGSSVRVLRGGSWSHTTNYCLSWYRDYYYPSISNDYIGFRLVRTIN